MSFVSFLVSEGSEYPQGIRFTVNKHMYDLSIDYGSKFSGFAEFLNDIGGFCKVVNLVEKDGTLATKEELESGVFCDCIDGDVNRINCALAYIGNKCVHEHDISLYGSEICIPRVKFKFSEVRGFERLVYVSKARLDIPIKGVLWDARVLSISVNDDTISVDIEEVRSPASRTAPSEEVKYTVAISLTTLSIKYYNKISDLPNNEILVNSEKEILRVDKDTLNVNYSLCDVTDINEYLKYIICTPDGDYFLTYKKFREVTKEGVLSNKYYSCYKQTTSGTVKLFSSRRDSLNILDSSVKLCLSRPIELSGVQITGAYEVLSSFDKYMFS